MSLAPLICPFCGSEGMRSLPNKKLRPTLIVTPYYCPSCQRTVESGPIQLRRKTHPSASKRKRHVD